MAWIPEDLKHIQQQVEEGQSPQVRVRTMLSWYGAQRRGTRVVNMLRSSLRSLNLETEPDFDSVWVDLPVSFHKSKGTPSGGLLITPVTATVSESPIPLLLPALKAGEVHTETEVEVPVQALVGHDPSYSVRKLEAANRPPVSVKPDTTISEAVSKMLMQDFSQLPVMTSERTVKGLFSWKSLGSRLALQQPCNKVSDAMDRVKTVSGEASIFQVADILALEEVVLVQASANDTKITGILTTSDLAEQFGRLGEPFLLIGEIENRVRVIIDGKFTAQQLASARNPDDNARAVESVVDLTFGEYIRLLAEPSNWERCKLVGIDRATFIRHLEEVREIRNDVMHFDPDSVGPEQLQNLRQFASFLEKIAFLRA